MSSNNLEYIASELTAKQETIAVAESVTSGLLMASFSLAKMATDFFQGGITAYNLGQKTRHLKIDPIHGNKINCVSERVAQRMALQVAEEFCCSWGIGVTGYAVPVPALDITKCFAYYSFASHGVIRATHRIDTDSNGQKNVQQFFVDHIVDAFAKHLAIKI